MQYFNLFLLGMVAGAMIHHFVFEPKHNNHIQQIITDNRGLSSVKFIQDGKEWGLDYLTHKQLDSLINKLGAN